MEKSIYVLYPRINIIRQLFERLRRFNQLLINKDKEIDN